MKKLFLIFTVMFSSTLGMEQGHDNNNENNNNTVITVQDLSKNLSELEIKRCKKLAVKVVNYVLKNWHNDQPNGINSVITLNQILEKILKEELKNINNKEECFKAVKIFINKLNKNLEEKFTEHRNYLSQRNDAKINAQNFKSFWKNIRNDICQEVNLSYNNNFDELISKLEDQDSKNLRKLLLKTKQYKFIYDSNNKNRRKNFIEGDCFISIDLMYILLVCFLGIYTPPENDAALIFPLISIFIVNAVFISVFIYGIFFIFPYWDWESITDISDLVNKIEDAIKNDEDIIEDDQEDKITEITQN